MGTQDTIKQLETDIERLWNMLDDIDSLSDMIKPHDEESYKVYLKAVSKIANRRAQVRDSDGYKLFMPGEMPQPPVSGDVPVDE